MLKIQKVSDKLFVLLFLYNKNINMNRPTTESDVAVYGMIRSSSLFLFMDTWVTGLLYNIKLIVNIFTY